MNIVSISVYIDALYLYLRNSLIQSVKMRTGLEIMKSELTLGMVAFLIRNWRDKPGCEISIFWPK